ncbi:RNA polymerase subunit sigma-24 (plasmid) [Fulvitalea axinellae]|uniref:RNA polymerase subunit sigma-24 n=1 Tax=Fulvitalea axinellae TaxID=1182444 RepID=A0AAU9DMM5_9BACT|nr:RNA polymerase subunit sigma-24 [Fulvitalea axinellae]
MSERKNEDILKPFDEEQGKLRNFIRRNVPSLEDAEDILQDVFYQYLLGYDNIRDLEKVTGWIYRVARNKITDLFRKKGTRGKQDSLSETETDDGPLHFQDLLPSLEGNPESEFLREQVWEELEKALDDLPEEQRRVFVCHELEGKGFKQISAETGVAVNTLISRKRYAILFLRKRLRHLYEQY